MEIYKTRSSFSRFASKDEVKSSLYRVAFDNNNPTYGGIPLFSDNDAVYIENDDVHSLIFGSTGSKKTRLIAMPALQMYAKAGESFIATDPKGELYAKTYQLLKEREYKICVLNLRDPTRSNAWNPLSIPYYQYHNNEKDKAIEFISDFSNCITRNSHNNDSYWDNSAANLLAGLILILFEHGKENEIHFKSLRSLRTQAFKICDNETSFIKKQYLQYLDNTSFLSSLLSGITDVTETTRSCIISVYDQTLRPFVGQESLIDMLAGNDFELGSIGNTKTAIFLIIPDENTLYNKLISVFIKQCYCELLREALKHPNNKLPIRVNFLLDEFANLPTISDFPAMITASRSRNIRFNLFVQSINQLNEKYQYESNTIRGNCENWIFLHSRELGLLNEIVNLSGFKNPETYLVSISTLSTLDKTSGEAYILSKRLYPYIANLLDIDKYPINLTNDQNIEYPQNTHKADKIFDFEACCLTMDNSNGKPVFVSSKPSDENINIEIFEENNNEIEEEIEEEDEEEEIIFTSKIPIERYTEGVESGWKGLILPILDEIKEYNEIHPDNEVEIDYINEKYGMLNIHMLKAPDYIRGMCSIAQSESEHICQICGCRGERVEINHWLYTLCPNHIKAKKVAGFDNNLTSKLYRKFTDTYERNLWKGSYNPVMKKCIKKNWFIINEKVYGILRTIKLEREYQKTNFYIKIENNFFKHEIYVQWADEKDITIHNGYWHIKKLNDIEEFGILDRKTAEIEAAKKIFCYWDQIHKNMELIKMISFEEGLSHNQCSVQKNFDDYWLFVKEYLVKNNIKMTSAEHNKYGVPLIENNGTVYAFMLSNNKWGKLMAEAFEPDNKDESAYLKWAGERPEGEISWVNPDIG